MTVTHEEARRAVQWLIDSAAEYATAIADRERCDAMLRVVKAGVMQRGEGAVSAQERDAYASPQYLAAIDALHAATLNAEKLRALRQAAALKIELYRTSAADARAAERGMGSARGLT